MSVLTPKTLEELISPSFKFQASAPLVIATSGGRDSMCLAFLANKLSRAKGVPMFSLVVDHKVRPESTKEALIIQHYLYRLGIQSVILAINDLKTSSEAKMREKRYLALTKWCLEHKVEAFFTAHHQDDQLETFFIRLEKGSSPWGLSGMLPITKHHGITVLRPLLSVSSRSIQETCHYYNIPWIYDPSNHDMSIMRNKVRQFWKKISKTDKHLLLKITQKIQQKRTQHEKGLSDFLQKNTVHLDTGSLLVNKKAFQHITDEKYKKTALQKLLVLCRGSTSHPIPYKKINALLRHLACDALQTHFTLGGVLIGQTKTHIIFMREWERIDDTQVLLTGQHTLLWDDRYWIQLSTPCNIIVKPLGITARRLLQKKEACENIAKAFLFAKMTKNHQYKALASLPSFWSQDALLFVPYLQTPPITTQSGFQFPRSFHIQKIS